MAKLFSAKDESRIQRSAQKSKQVIKPPKTVNARSISNDLASISQSVIEYFQGSQAILITSKEMLHDYVTNLIDSGIAGIDTETTGVDRVNDWIVGASLYYPGSHECYIPMKHLVPIFDTPYKNQLTYDEVREEFQRIVDSDTKLVFANADFDLAMIYKDIKVDLKDRCWYDVQIAWRCLKEDEPHNGLKELYSKYVLKGEGDPRKFSDFFPPKLFPYCKPEVAKLYAANDAKITYELCMWQLPYISKDNPKCKKNHLERIADLIWNVEFPLIKVCHVMHRTGMYLDNETAKVLMKRYKGRLDEGMRELRSMVQDVIDHAEYVPGSKPFLSGKDFNPKSPQHVKYLVYKLLKVPVGRDGESTDKEVLAGIKLPVTDKILEVRSLEVLINTFVEKLPNATTPDSRIHGQFKQIGARCVVGSTVIPTSEGYYLARDLCRGAPGLEGQHAPLSGIWIANKDQQAEEAESCVSYANQRTIRITTDFGFVIEGTADHPIMVSKYTSADKSILYKSHRLQNLWNDRRFKLLDDIQVGDIVEIPCNYYVGPTSYVDTGLVLRSAKTHNHRNVRIPSKYTEEFAEWLGMYHADGTSDFSGGSFRVTLSNCDKDVIDRFRYLCERLFCVTPTMWVDKNNPNEVESTIACVQLGNLKSILPNGATNKRIPRAIWKSPKSVINSYIKGMTLDSSLYVDAVSHKSTRYRFDLTVANADDARMIQVHLASQGILCGWGHNYYKDGTMGVRLDLSADNYVLFRDLIGFIETNKIQMDVEPNRKNPYHRRRIGDSFRVQVKSIEYGAQDVYDLHVPGTHSFISNGIISHNTGRFSSKEPNMQNIPSHATDIRHLFRATVADIQNIDCEEDTTSGELKVQIPNWNKVYLEDGSTSNAIDLTPGQTIKVYKDQKETWMQVKQIAECPKDVGVRDIVLDVPDYGGGQI